MPRRQDDDVAWPSAPDDRPRPETPRPATTRYGRSAPATPGTRTLLRAGGFLLAVGATLAVFLTDNAQLLRVAVVAVAWAFVLATVAAGRRSSDRAAAAAREQQLRQDYRLELEREVAARREYELELENELRRETEDAVRGELDALRGEIAALSGLRDEVARVSALRGDIAALGALREEVARVAALRDDVAALNALRLELGQIGELRADMGRLRAELTEQLSSEMLVERITMRTQASRLPSEQGRPDGAGRTLDVSASWSGDTPPRELTGGWPAIRLDEPRETQQFEQVRADRSTARVAAPWAPATSTYAAAQPAPATPPAAYEPPPVPAPAPAVFSILPAHAPVERPEPAPRHSRHAADEPARPPATAAFPLAPPTPSTPAPSPLDWLAARSLLDPAPPYADPVGDPSGYEPAPRRRRSDDVASPAVIPDEYAPTAARPVVPARGEGTGPKTTDRLARILAENGVAPTGGRRRRRYREDDEPDEVLSRVLGRHP